MSIEDDREDKGALPSQFRAVPANDESQLEDLRPRSPAEALEPSRAPEPPVRKKRRKPNPFLSFMNGIMTFLVVGLLGIGGAIYVIKLQFDQPGPLGHSTVVVIPKGEGVNAIAERLEREGIISDRRIFVASALYFRAQDKLKAGEYEVRKKASMRDVLDQLVRGKAILHKVTVPEGLTSQQVVERLNKAPFLEGEVTEIPPEGSLMPDTYKYSRGMTRAEVLERMQAEQRKFVKNLWGGRASDLPFKTPAEAITLASIVEKETGRADERSRVAGVFVNRLRKGMRLQSDPTIIYGLAGGKGTLERPILKADIQKATPYNTYVIDGLPPGPIANPGRAAIEAVLNPAETEDLYFVADGTGGHAFAPTLAAHNQNVARWRQIEREMRERQAAEAAAKAKAEAEQQQGDAPSAGTAPIAGLPSLTGGESSLVPGLALDSVPGMSMGEMLELPAGTLQTAQETSPRAQPAAAPSAAERPAAPSGPAVPLPLRNPRLGR